MASAAATAHRKGPSRQESPRAKVWLYLTLLTLQYGAQPLISKRFIRRDVIVTSSVLACEMAKVICALFLLAKEGSFKRLWKEWTLVGALTASGLPAAIYALQNSLLQISYKNLDSLTFSILNQTKLFFTAFFTYLILGQKQSPKQIGALTLLIVAAILLSVGESSDKASASSNSDQVLLYGIIPVMIASVLSGLASSLCQWASQVKKHTSYIMTVEMSFVGSLCLLASTYKSPDGEAIRKYGFFHGWTVWTLSCSSTDTSCNECCRRDSCRSCHCSCWRCQKGVCYSLCIARNCNVAVSFRWETTLGVLPCGTTSCHQQYCHIPEISICCKKEGGLSTKSF
ncbi:UDP-N-acetylglucosamine transporter ROCK1-like isoform X2 [Musa acuminata AAA Group]|uniref:UDP-N-acetylglucosamine transporter ROCK1-like isoform X2 n=1 Tax=Musa acuminata AAA Group TaxID=214697 RepID=UPI0031D23D1B